jgi:alanine racemase
VTRYRPTVVEVDLDAIRHNVRLLKPPRAELMAVVKADGYGHGAVPVARAALEAGASRLGAALVEEGLSLREAGIASPILVLTEFPPGSEKEALEAGLTPSLYSEPGLEGLAEASRALGRPAAVHLKLDTGMHRVGLWPPAEAPAFARRILDAGLEIEGVWTHFADAERDGEGTRHQLRVFRDAVDALAAGGVRPRILHAANSGAAIQFPDTHLDLVRPGAAVYGLDPGDGIGERAGLRPALTWRSAVSMVKRLPAGERLSYGGRYVLERESTIATVPVGYDDGYPRRAEAADVLIGDARRPVAGTITMDQILVDCGDAAVAVGDEVVLIGGQAGERVTADELAERAGTIGRQIATGIGRRVPREYVATVQDEAPT